MALLTEDVFPGWAELCDPSAPLLLREETKCWDLNQFPFSVQSQQKAAETSFSEPQRRQVPPSDDVSWENAATIETSDWQQTPGGTVPRQASDKHVFIVDIFLTFIFLLRPVNAGRHVHSASLRLETWKHGAKWATDASCQPVSPGPERLQVSVLTLKPSSHLVWTWTVSPGSDGVC